MGSIQRYTCIFMLLLYIIIRVPTNDHTNIPTATNSSSSRIAHSNHVDWRGNKFLLLLPKTINNSFYSFSSKPTTYYIVLWMLSEYDVLCCFRYLGNVKHFATVFYLLKLAVHSTRHASMLSTVNTSCAMPHRKQHIL